MRFLGIQGLSRHPVNSESPPKSMERLTGAKTVGRRIPGEDLGSVPKDSRDSPGTETRIPLIPGFKRRPLYPRPGEFGAMELGGR